MQRYYELPELTTIVDCDTRVATTVFLFQRTIINYAAFKAYFEQCATYDDPQMFSKPDFADWRLMVEMEAVTKSLAELTSIEVQRSNQVASELIVLLEFAIDRLGADSYNIYDMDALRTPKTNEKTLTRRSIHLSVLSAEGQICVARIKGQVAKRLSTLTAEYVAILLLDPRTKFTVESLVRPAARDDTDADSDNTDAINADGKQLLRCAHQEVFCAMRAGDSNDSQNAAVDTPPNMDLVPTVDDDLVICGAPLMSTPANSESMSSIRDQANQVLDEWFTHTEQWARVAVHQTTDESMTTEDFTKQLLVRRNSEVCWRLQVLCKHVDVCRWYRETRSAKFPFIAALARVWFGRSPSNAFQERVFSTGALVMNSRRSSTDNHRAEKQVLMKHTRSEFRRMEMENERPERSCSASPSLPFAPPPASTS